MSRFRSQLPFPRELLFELFDWPEQVACFLDPSENFVGTEFQEIGFFLFQAVCDFIPGDRSGNGRLFPGAK